MQNKIKKMYFASIYSVLLFSSLNSNSEVEIIRAEGKTALVNKQAHLDLNKANAVGQLQSYLADYQVNFRASKWGGFNSWWVFATSGTQYANGEGSVFNAGDVSKRGFVAEGNLKYTLFSNSSHTSHTLHGQLDSIKLGHGLQGVTPRNLASEEFNISGLNLSSNASEGRNGEVHKIIYGLMKPKKVIDGNKGVKHLEDKLNENDLNITGNNLDNQLQGYLHDDTLIGGKGNDILLSSRGNDIMKGGEGNDLLINSEGNNTLIGGTGNDTFLFVVKDGRNTFGKNIIEDFNTEEDIIILKNENHRNLTPKIITFKSTSIIQVFSDKKIKGLIKLNGNYNNKSIKISIK